MADAPDLTLFHSNNLESRVKALENDPTLLEYNGTDVAYASSDGYANLKTITITKGVWVLTGWSQITLSQPTLYMIQAINTPAGYVNTTRYNGSSGGGACTTLIHKVTSSSINVSFSFYKMASLPTGCNVKWGFQAVRIK